VPKERATIRMVAQTAGVSIATVSRVFAGAPSVSAALRHRVTEAARQLDYTPHPVARSLALGRTQIVGLLVPNLANPSVCGLIKHLLGEAERADHRLVVTDTDDDPESEAAVGTSLLQHVDALILCAPQADAEVLDALAGHGKPVVVVNRAVDSPRLGNVLVDDTAALRDLAAHLASLGHRRVAYLRGPSRSWQDARRWQAVRSLAEHGVEVTPVEGGGRLDDGRRGAEAVLRAGCTAVIAFNDLMAFGVMAALREHGARVPDDVSVTGCDDVPLARCVTPTLTTVRGRLREAGAATWRMVAGMLGGAAPERPVVLETEAVIRDSTGPCPRPAPVRAG
jgi:LacI family transcriptional regulator